MGPLLRDHFSRNPTIAISLILVPGSFLNGSASNREYGICARRLEGCHHHRWNCLSTPLSQYNRNVVELTVDALGQSGIGLALAQHLHLKGWRVALVGRRSDIGQRQASSIDPTGQTAVFEQCNVASYSEQATTFKAVWDRWGRLDLLIANAGGVDSGSLYNFRRRGVGVDDVPPEPDTTCTNVHFKGVMYGTVLATHFMRHNQPRAGGKIIATTSMLGVQPCPTFPEYCSVEAGIIHWVRVSAPLLRSKENITINTVMMGPAITPVMPGFAKAFVPEQ